MSLAGSNLSLDTADFSAGTLFLLPDYFEVGGAPSWSVGSSISSSSDAEAATAVVPGP